MRGTTEGFPSQKGMSCRSLLLLAWSMEQTFEFPLIWNIRKLVWPQCNMIKTVPARWWLINDMRITSLFVIHRHGIKFVLSYHKLEDIIRDISEMVTIGEVRRVTKDDGRFGDTEGVSHGVMGHVGQVHQHAYAVHLLHHDLQIYSDVMAWKRFRHDWPFVMGILRSPVESPHKRSEIASFVISFVAIMNELLNKQSICRGSETPWCSYDVIVMTPSWCLTTVISL